MNSTDVQSEADQENFVIMGSLSGQEYENLVEVVKGLKKMRTLGDSISDCYCTGGARVGSGGGDCRCTSGARAKLVV